MKTIIENWNGEGSTFLLTEEWLKQQVNARNNLSLIKAYRACTRMDNGVSGMMGLKDAKDLIEIYPGRENIGTDKEATKERILALFSKWLPEQVSISDSVGKSNYTAIYPLSSPLSESKINPEKEQILEAVGFAFDNWQILGYYSPYQAAKAIIDNYEKKSQLL